MSKDTSLSLVERWTSSCLESHGLCNTSRKSGYPSRLLSLTGDSIRLITTDKLNSKLRYATLSHQWGNQKITCLNKRNVDAFHQAIPDDSLSQTFKDAVEIALGAKLHYLWIDSLCIIQGDNADWEIEASKMASVYGGSSLNIAASDSMNAKEGCFLKPVYFCNGFDTAITINGSSDVYGFMRDDTYAKSVLKTRLSNRGWVMQEKILSPRTLHCGRMGMFWECKTTIASEFFPNGLKHHLKARSESLVYKHPVKTLLDSQALECRWWTLCFRYSSCDLTYPGDKLVAISGVAREFQQRNGGLYYAGLWREGIEEQLCWQPLEPQTRPAYRAPSWSWAAVDGVIKFSIQYPPAETLYIRMLSCNVAATPDQFGAVSDGWMSLQCQGILRGSIVSSETARKASTPPDDLQASAWAQAAEAYADLGQPKQDFRFCLDCAGEIYARLSTAVYFLPVLQRHGNRRHKSQKGPDGLLMQSVTVQGLVLDGKGLDKGRYRRIGYFDFENAGFEENEYHPFMSLLEISGKQVAEEHCIEVARNSEHPDEKEFVICLV